MRLGHLRAVRPRGARGGSLRHVAVLGLGRFGLSVAKALVEQGYDVLGIDASEDAVQRAKNILTHVVQAALDDTSVMRELGLHEFDAGVVAIGTDVEANIVGTALLLEVGVPYVVARANSPLHGTILSRVGAHRVVYPEVTGGEAVARSLGAPDVIDHLVLSSSVGISTLQAPAPWVGKTLGELALDGTGPFTVVAIQRGANTLASPGSSERVEAADVLALLAQERDLHSLPQRPRDDRP